MRAQREAGLKRVEGVGTPTPFLLHGLLGGRLGVHRGDDRFRPVAFCM